MLGYQQQTHDIPQVIVTIYSHCLSQLLAAKSGFACISKFQDKKTDWTCPVEVDHLQPTFLTFERKLFCQVSFEKKCSTDLNQMFEYFFWNKIFLQSVALN